MTIISCLFITLAFFPTSIYANNIRGDVISDGDIGFSHQMMAKEALTKSGISMMLGHPHESSELEKLHVAEKGENSINPLATASFFTYGYREDFSCDTTKPTFLTWGYLTETCFTAPSSSGVNYTTFAYRCNESKFLLSFFLFLSSSSSSSWLLLHYLQQQRLLRKCYDL
jgi:hypothetical protein